MFRIILRENVFLKQGTNPETGQYKVYKPYKITSF